jgi:flagellar basal-body rod protein FlgB
MTTENLTLMQAAIRKMHWHEERQKVLSQNIANADTPSYKPQDIDPLDFKELLASSTSKLSLGTAATAGVAAGEMATTNSKHLGLNGSAPGKLVTKTEKDPYETSPSGNSVVLEEQLLKMNQNDTDHRLTTTIYQKNLDMLKSALR